MDYGDYYWGLYRGYYRDPFPHSLLSTRQLQENPAMKSFHGLERLHTILGGRWPSLGFDSAVL